MINNDELENVVNNILNWIRSYVQNANAKGVVIGNSGGKDSATVIALATKALGKENVLTIAMPISSNSKDMEDAKLVSNTFEVPFIELDLTASFDLLKNSIEGSLGSQISNEGIVNMKPRLRMLSLYSIAQTNNYLVMGTGNLCERMVGYTTKWGDSASDLNPIANFTVEEVIQIGKHLGVPDEVINKAPNDGLSSKTDEEKMGVKYSQIAEYILTRKN